VFKGKGTVATFRSVWISVAVLALLILLLVGMTWTTSSDDLGHTIFQVFMLILLVVLLVLTLMGMKDRRDTANLFKTSFHVNPSLCAITMLDTGEHLDVNNAWLTALGYQRHEVIGKTAVELRIWGAGNNSRGSMLKQLKEKGKIDSYETQIRARNGSLVDVILSAEQMKVGGQDRLFVAAHDITKRKLAEQIQRDQQAQLIALSEAPFDAIFISEKGICTGQNVAAAEIFGYTLEEALGQPAINWVAPESRALVTENIVAGCEKAYEAVGLRKDGSTFAVELHGKMTQYNGRTVRVTALRDISERKLADAQLRLLSTVVEQSPVAVMVTDTQGAIEYVNPWFETRS